MKSVPRGELPRLILGDEEVDDEAWLDRRPWSVVCEPELAGDPPRTGVPHPELQLLVLGSSVPLRFLELPAKSTAWTRLSPC